MPLDAHKYVANPLYADALALYADHVQRHLYPILEHHTVRLMQNRHHDEAFTPASCWTGKGNATVFFRIGLRHEILDDLLCTPELQALAKTDDPRRVLEGVANAKNVDAYVRDRAHYVLQVLNSANACYREIQDTLHRLATEPAFERDCIQLRLTGAPPADGAARLTFQLQFHASVHEGWTQCKKCEGWIPSHPNTVGPDGQVLCPNLECVVQA